MTWSDIKKQAREIKRRKTTKAQQRQAAKYFEMVRQVLRPSEPEGKCSKT